MSSDELILEIFIITIFSIIQSIFGMGLLVFGTPTFLLLEYSFDETLSLLVPVSVTISALQLYSSTKKVDKKIIKYFFVWSLPLIVICLAVVIHFKLDFEINLILALMLILSAIINLSGKSKSNLSGLVKKHPRISFVFMGCVHGTSNMGGAVLSVLSNAYYLKKEKILNFVAFCYFSLVLCRLLLLLLSKVFKFIIKSAFFALLRFAHIWLQKKQYT